jgi:hypothetical protein
MGGAGPVGVGVLASIIGDILPLLWPAKPGLSWALRLCESVEGCEPSAEPGTGLISMLGGLSDGAASLVRPKKPAMTPPGPGRPEWFVSVVLVRLAGVGFWSEISSTSDNLFSFLRTEPEVWELVVGVSLKREDEAMPPMAVLSNERFRSDCESASLANEPWRRWKLSWDGRDLMLALSRLRKPCMKLVRFLRPASVTTLVSETSSPRKSLVIRESTEPFLA